MAQSKLDHLRKIVRIMNSRTTSLYHIFYMGTTSKAHEGLGYQKGSSETKPTIQKKNPLLKLAKLEGIV